jgi:hypothetical protein
VVKHRCTDAKITILFIPDAPLPISCVPAIYLQNLTDILSPSSNETAIVDNGKCGDALKGAGFWDKLKNELVVPLKADIPGNTSCQFEVFLTKKTCAPFFGAKISASPLLPAQTLIGQSSCTQQTNDEVLLNIVACQSSSYPCMDNTITVTVQSSDPLYRRCNPKLIISGLRLSLTSSNTSLPTSYTLGSGPARTSGLVSSWNQSDGKIVRNFLEFCFWRIICFAQPKVLRPEVI